MGLDSETHRVVYQHVALGETAIKAAYDIQSDVTPEPGEHLHTHADAIAELNASQAKVTGFILALAPFAQPHMQELLHVTAPPQSTPNPHNPDGPPIESTGDANGTVDNVTPGEEGGKADGENPTPTQPEPAPETQPSPTPPAGGGSEPDTEAHKRAPGLKLK